MIRVPAYDTQVSRARESYRRRPEDSMECLRNLPTRNPASFTSSSSDQCSLTPKMEEPQSIVLTHDISECRSYPVITTESTSILVREFEQMQKAKERQTATGKRHIEQSYKGEKRSKHPRRQCLFEGNYKELQEGSYTALSLSSA